MQDAILFVSVLYLVFDQEPPIAHAHAHISELNANRK
jgi:hypothetical protein